MVRAHDADFGVGPHPKETGGVGASAGGKGLLVVTRKDGRGIPGLPFDVCDDGERKENFQNSPHSVVARPGAGSKYHGKFGHLGACHRGDQLSPVFGNSALLRVGTNHEPADVLQEDEWDMPLGAELDEMCPFERGFGEENPVVGNDTDLFAVDAGEA